MQYRSTRGGVEGHGFADVLIDGLAGDGGLFLPASIPRMNLSGGDYAAVAADMMRPFLFPDPLADEISSITAEVYGRFRHPEVAPIRQVDSNRHLLELFWGPTFSFKDYALQIVGALFDRVLARRQQRILVLGATSGDTGSAAIEACRGRDGIDVVILYPDGGVSEVQRRQMTTVVDANVHCVAIRGTFDDCQRLVKEAFSAYRPNLPLAAINSINWARIMAQTAYYAYAANRFEGPVDFVVPTGNFGNVLSGHIARRMGAAVGNLTIANNSNHGLADLLASGTLKVGDVTATVAPAMDIQIPSNLERYLYEANGNDPSLLRAIQDQLATTGEIVLSDSAITRLRSDFSASWVSDDEVVSAIRRVHADFGLTLDPHTAVAWEAASAVASERDTVVVSTAHPAKFGDVVTRAIGTPPPLPPELADLFELDERVTLLDADLGVLGDLLRSVT